MISKSNLMQGLMAIANAQGALQIGEVHSLLMCLFVTQLMLIVDSALPAESREMMLSENAYFVVYTEERKIN